LDWTCPSYLLYFCVEGKYIGFNLLRLRGIYNLANRFLFHCLYISRSAFAPATQSPVRSSSLNAWADNAAGVVAPTGFFDPLGLSKGKSDATMAKYRESELKHGRVAMAACLGWFITSGGTHPAFNGALSSNPLEAATQWSPAGWGQFVLGCGAVEWLTEKIKERPGYQAGDVLGAAYWVDNSDKGWLDYQNREISNGRLAMLAIMGLIAQDLLFKEYGDKLFTVSP